MATIAPRALRLATPVAAPAALNQVVPLPIVVLCGLPAAEIFAVLASVAAAPAQCVLQTERPHCRRAAHGAAAAAPPLAPAVAQPLQR